MWWALRILSLLSIMTFGYIWTVGQGGFLAVNKNLCDLWEDTFGPPPSCQFNRSILLLWGVGALLAVLFLIFDAVRWLRNRRNARSNAASSLIGSPLKIEFGNDDKYERTEHIDETGIFRRMIYVSVVNKSLDEISECNIRLIAASPRPKTGDNPTNFPVLFRANFDLHGKQRKFIQIVSFAENAGGNPSSLERDNIIILCAEGGLFQGWTTIPIPSIDNPAILTLEAFAPDIASRRAHLRIWVDQRRLHAKII